MDINKRASEILTLLANAIHDRSNSDTPTFFHFNANELKIVEEWMSDVVKELTSSPP